MVVQVYISSCSGNKEVKKHQEFLTMLLSSKKIEYELIDISLQDNDEQKHFMWENSRKKEGQNKPMPPQIFNDQEYCGDYELFDEANEDGLLMEFLKLATPKVTSTASVNVTQNGGGDTEVPEANGSED